MPGFMDQLMNGLDSSPERRRREADANMAETQVDQKKHDFDMRLWDHMNEIGALPSVGGMVKAPMYDTSAPPEMQDAVVTRPADKTRLFTHKTADGQTVQFEMPDEPTQQRRALYQHMQSVMGPAQQQIRGAADENAAATQEATQLGSARGKNKGDVEKRASEGIAIPKQLEDVLPGIATGADGQPVKVLPSELDDITRAAGQFANYQSEAATRKNPAKKVIKSELSRDDQGNQTIINSYGDGTTEEVPVKAKGVTAKGGANGQPTPYQQYTMGRNTQNDTHARAMVWQNKLDTLQSEEDKLSEQNVSAGREMTEIGTQLQNGELTGTTAKNQAKRRLSTLQAQIDGNNQRVKAIGSQKKNALTIKNSIMSASGGAVAQEQAKANAAPKTANLGQVNAYAKKYGLTLEAAQKAFEDDGVTVQK